MHVMVTEILHIYIYLNKQSMTAPDHIHDIYITNVYMTYMWNILRQIIQHYYLWIVESEQKIWFYVHKIHPNVNMYFSLKYCNSEPTNVTILVHIKIKYDGFR